MESEEDDEGEDQGAGSPEEWSGVVRKLEAQLNDLQTCSDLITKHWKSLVKPLSEMEMNADPEDIKSRVKEVCERATLYRISTNAMINVSELFGFRPGLCEQLGFSLLHNTIFLPFRPAPNT